MKLLVDEMYPAVIADQLRARGHDAHAVVERAELRALADRDLFALAQSERRAIATENIADFSVIADDHDRSGQVHHGLVLILSSKYPRGDPQTVGRMIRSLTQLLTAQHSEEPKSLRLWL